MIYLQCDWCGKEVKKYPSQIMKHVFCCSECRSKYLSKENNPSGYIRHEHLSKYNKDHNHERMTIDVRKKLRDSRLNQGTGKTYSKIFGRHEHRVVAEKMLGRKLLPGEVVHHVDHDKRNNNPDNLMIFRSQAEHARYHAAERR